MLRNRTPPSNSEMLYLRESWTPMQPVTGLSSFCQKLSNRLYIHGYASIVLVYNKEVQPLSHGRFWAEKYSLPAVYAGQLAMYWRSADFVLRTPFLTV